MYAQVNVHLYGFRYGYESANPFEIGASRQKGEPACGRDLTSMEVEEGSYTSSSTSEQLWA